MLLQFQTKRHVHTSSWKTLQYMHEAWGQEIPVWKQILRDLAWGEKIEDRYYFTSHLAFWWFYKSKVLPYIVCFKPGLAHKMLWMTCKAKYIFTWDK